MAMDPFGFEWQLRALIARTGYANTVNRDVQRILDAALRETAARVLVDAGATRDRLDALYRTLQTLLNEAYGRAQTTATTHLVAYAQVEADIAAHAVTRALTGSTSSGLASLVSLGAPSRQLVVAAANLSTIVARVDIGGIGFGDWWRKGAVDTLMRVRRTVQSGLIMGQGPEEIARRIFSHNRLRPGAAQLTRLHARTVVRTAVNGVQNEAALASYRASGGVQRVRYEAILDARTSDICRALDNTVWSLDDPKIPQLPAHPNCRSTYVPIPDGAAVGVSGDRLDPGASRTTYEAWLRQQTPFLQNSILGPSRAALWRRGRVTLADLIGSDRRTLTLDQLRARLDPAA
jgi:SPP1 gp7 family putative phage head morphogenesis protein